MHFGFYSNYKLEQVKSLPYLYHVKDKQLYVRNYNITHLKDVKTIFLDEDETIAHHKGKYYVTSKGRYLRKHGLFTAGEIASKRDKKKGYLTVSPSIDGEQTTIQLSHTILDSFHPETQNTTGVIDSEGNTGIRECIDHINRDVKNNSLDNIQRVTSYENYELIKLRNRRDKEDEVPSTWNDLIV